MSVELDLSNADRNASVGVRFCIGIALASLTVPVLAPAASTETRALVTQQQVADSGAIIEPSLRMTFPGAPWDYEIRIGLPGSYYKSNVAYPVLWVTDGSRRFEHSVSTVNFAAMMKEVPEMVVIAIGAPPEAIEQFGIRRTYDFSAASKEPCSYSGPGRDVYDKQCKLYLEGIPRKGLGGAPKFLSFLTDDVRAAIKKKYRVNQENTLFGYSAGGEFCGYALLSRPEAFDRYICGSPSFGELFALEEQYAKAHSDLKEKVFFAAGDREILQGEGIAALGVVSSMVRMAEILRSRGYPSLELHVRILPDRAHGPVTANDTLYWGLRTLFRLPAQDRK